MSRKAAQETPFEIQVMRRTPTGPAAETPIEEALREQPEGALDWIDVVVHDIPAATTFLVEKLGFLELEAEDALSTKERPHLHEAPDHLFLAAPSIWIVGHRVFYAEIGVYVCAGRLVTVSARKSKVIEAIQARWMANGLNHHANVSWHLYSLLDALVDAYYPALDELESQADRLENEVFQARPVQVKDLLRLKRRLLEMRRRLSPFRDIVNGLLRHDCPVIGAETRPYFQDVHDHVLRVLESVDLNRDILASVLDAHLANVSNRLNEVMRLLTVIATFLMTMALVTGWYGMNFKHMPELDWPWTYPALIGVMALIAGAEWWFFKRKGWL